MRMRSKITVGKSVSIVLIVSMIGMGTATSIPRAYAASNVENAVTADSIANILSQLKIINPDGSSTDQNVVSGTYQYSLTVKNSISRITLFLKEANDKGSITVGKQNTTDHATTDISLTPSQNPGEYTTAEIPINVGENTIMISVSDGTNQTQYSLKVTREKADATTGTPSPGSSTSGKTKPGTSKPGTSKTGSYTSAKKQNSSRSITISHNSTSNINRSGASGSQGANITQKPSTATLSALTLSSGTWNKAFSQNSYTYHITVTKDVDSVTINDTTTYSGASVTVNGSTSNVIELGNQKKTIVPIVVTNGNDRKTYVLVFNKEIPLPKTTPTETTATTGMNTGNIESTTNLSYNKASAYQGAWNNQSNSSSASWWSRLIDSIKSFINRL